MHELVFSVVSQVRDSGCTRNSCIVVFLVVACDYLFGQRWASLQKKESARCPSSDSCVLPPAHKTRLYKPDLTGDTDLGGNETGL